MKKILLSLLVVAVVAGTIYGTSAYFTDEEKSVGNTFTTGTIDIAVDGQNPWVQSETVKVEDMKPSQHAYGEYVIHNVGSNPANVWKRVDITDRKDVVQTEPECFEEGGKWDGKSCDYGDGQPRVNIDEAIRYDMTVWVYDQDPTVKGVAPVKPKWWQVIYTDAMNKRLNTVNGVQDLLGMVPAGWYMKVQQSYHMDERTTNWAQGDALTFDITLTAEQLKGEVLMENKDFANKENPTLVHGDGVQGKLTYVVKDTTFKYSFDGTAPLANTNYSLVFYLETWSSPSGNAPAWPRDVIVLGSATSNGSKVVPTIAGEKDLGKDILNMKVWLVKTADIVGGKLAAWNGNAYLFELGMMDYYDSSP